MNDSRRFHHHDKVSTWLLTVTLFLGLFAFSFYARNTVSQEKEAPKTELVVSTQANAKHALSYAKPLAQFHKSVAPCAFHQSGINIMWFHNQLFKIRVGHYSGQVHCPQPRAQLFQQKIFPRNPDEDLFNSDRG